MLYYIIGDSIKKGFTLIELLAVILILGIIALIAIPTVNNIISEARYGAFKSGNENIMKQVEQDCQTSLMKGENPALSYLFTQGKSNNKINIKGSLPNDGYIILNRSCEIIDYYLIDNKNVYSKNGDGRKDYMLKAPSEEETSIFKTIYFDYYDKIISVDFVNNLDIHENAIEIKDPSVSEKGKIKSWLVPDGEFYKLYIGSENNIFANYNSSYLLMSMENLITINTENLNTSFVNYMNNMFAFLRKLEYLDVSNFDTANTTSMRGTFQSCEILEYLDVSNFNTSNVVDMRAIFAYCESVKSLNVLNWDISNVKDLRSAFNNCQKIIQLDLSNWNTSSATNMRSMFYGCLSLSTIKGIENFKTDKVTTMYWMFTNCNKITELDLSKWNVDNVEDMTLIFICPILTKLNISTWSFNKITDFTNLFSSCDSLVNISVLNANIINQMAANMPDRIGNTPGTITIVGDKTNLDTSLLNSKNWNVV